MPPTTSSSKAIRKSQEHMAGVSGITDRGASRSLPHRIPSPLTSSRCSKQVFLITALLVWETIPLFSFSSGLKCKLPHLSRNQCFHHINRSLHHSIVCLFNSSRSRRLHPRRILRVHSSNFRGVQPGSMHDQMKRKLHPLLPLA